MCSEVSGGLCIYRKGFHVDEGSAIPKQFYCQNNCGLRSNRRRSQSDSEAIGVSRLGQSGISNAGEGEII